MARRDWVRRFSVLPLRSARGLAFVSSQATWLIDHLREAFDDDIEDEALREHPRLDGLAWEHDDETGVAARVLVLAIDEWDDEWDGSVQPDDWPEAVHLGGEIRLLRNVQEWVAGGVAASDIAEDLLNGVRTLEDGVELVAALETSGVERPSEAIARAVADHLERTGWPGVRRGPGFRAWTRIAGDWTPDRESPAEAPPTYPDLPHLSRWIDDDETARRFRRHVGLVADAVRAAFVDERLTEPLAAVGVMPGNGDEELGPGYVFGLTERRLAAETDPDRLLRYPANWDVDGLHEHAPARDEGEALATVLMDNGCFDPETWFLREVADALRAADWSGVPVTDSFIVVSTGPH